MSKARELSKLPNYVLSTVAELKLAVGKEQGDKAFIGGYYADGDGGGGDFYWDAVSVEADNGGTIFQVTGITTGRWKRIYSGSVSVKWFGAKGDGIADDTLAIQNTHLYANLTSKHVIYNISTTLIEANANIIVNTDVDFNRCEIKAKNGIATTPVFSPLNTMFVVKDESIVPISVTIDSAVLTEGQKTITLPNNMVSGMIIITTNKGIGRRTGDSTDLFYSQPFSINKNIINFPIPIDLSSYSNTALFYPDSVSPITISGLRSDSSTYNNQCLIRILRNNVIIEKVELVQKTNIGVVSINYLIAFNFCSNVTLRDSKIQPQYTTGTASYGINIESVADILIENCSGTGDSSWGVTSSNHINGIKVINSQLNRVDCHSGLHNLIVDNCSFDTNAVLYGWGSGFIKVRNSLIKDPISVIKLRQDFFGSFYGNIEVDNINIYSTYTSTPEATVNFAAIGAGGGTIVGDLVISNSVVIKDIYYHHGSSVDSLLVTAIQISKSSGLVNNVMFIPSITVDNIRSESRIALILNFKLYQFINSLVSKCLLSISNIKAFPNATTPMIYDSGAGISAYPVNKVNLELSFSNVSGITMWSVIPNAKVKILNSDVSSIRNYGGGSSNQDVNIYDSRIIETVSLGGAAVGIVCDGSNTNIFDTIIHTNCNVSTAKLLSGVALKLGAVVTLPATVTTIQAVEGWRSTSIYQ